MDTTAPRTSIEYSAAQTSGEPINYRFNWDDEAAVIYYTTDGTTPTLVVDEVQQPARAQHRRGADARPRRAPTRSSGWRSTSRATSPRSRRQRLLVAADDADGHRRRHRAGDAGADARRAGGVRAVRRRAWPATTRRRPRRRVLSTAGDATLSVADPSSTNTGHLVNGAFFLPQKLQAGTGTLAPSAARRPDDGEDLDRPDLQRGRAGQLQAVDRRQRRAAHGHVLQDADVHAVHDQPVAGDTGGCPAVQARHEPEPRVLSPELAIRPSDVMLTR